MLGYELEAREAVRQAYQAHYRRLVAALYGLTGDYAEAQDLVQEAYARALARPRQFLDVADPEAWLRTVAVNLARTRWRRRRLFDTLVRSGRVARQTEAVPGADPNRVALVAALQRLSRATRETIVLHHLADLSVHEVAEALGVPVGTVKARLSRGRTLLASLLSEHADDRRPAGAPTAGTQTAGAPPAAAAEAAAEAAAPTGESAGAQPASDRPEPVGDAAEPAAIPPIPPPIGAAGDRAAGRPPWLDLGAGHA
jgi:RNA polymerase sigma-70 factor (ECF subfamily)